MSSHDRELGSRRLDEATARRLSKLRTMPVDTAGLERALRAQLPPVPGAERAGRTPRAIAAWFRPMRAAAAAVVLLALVGTVVLTGSSGPAMASTDQMVRMHQDLVAGRIPAVQVDSIEAANRVLADESRHSPELPELPQGEATAPPDAHVMACCLKSVKNKRVACVLMKTEGVPVTLAVAKAEDMRSPKSPTVVRGGVTYHVQSAGSLNMVMTERQGRWVCLVAELPTERLMDIATRLEF